MPTASKERRIGYLQRGICPNCRCRPLLKPFTSCEVCKTRQEKWMHENRVAKDQYNKQRYEDLKSKGLCPHCKKPSGGHVYCETCQNKINARRAYYRGLHSRDKWSKR